MRLIFLPMLDLIRSEKWIREHEDELSSDGTSSPSIRSSISANIKRFVVSVSTSGLDI